MTSLPFLKDISDLKDISEGRAKAVGFIGNLCVAAVRSALQSSDFAEQYTTMSQCSTPQVASLPCKYVMFIDVGSHPQHFSASKCCGAAWVRREKCPNAHFTYDELHH
jgi:hypothetical protein